MPPAVTPSAEWLFGGLIAVNTVLLGITAYLIKAAWSAVWGEIASLRESRHDHANRLAVLDVRVEAVERDVAEVRQDVNELRGAA